MNCSSRWTFTSPYSGSNSSKIARRPVCCEAIRDRDSFAGGHRLVGQRVGSHVEETDSLLKNHVQDLLRYLFRSEAGPALAIVLNAKVLSLVENDQLTAGNSALADLTPSISQEQQIKLLPHRACAECSHLAPRLCPQTDWSEL